jgi:DNA polymerase-3 subunit gamma/tau
MAEIPTSLDGVTSLYRRFRPGRFAEMRGQEHVVRALQGAVERDRIVHAYLFSGPRGTGKTTTARILAKALNCQAPVKGDACNLCASCVAITKGASLDVVELDAASNNSVEDIREIIAGAWTGTSGRWKVYIVDEVHMLTKAAEAAFLKTLEEPPPHVVFVLATTDPHKVVSTIRSRTQHLEFRLLDAETLSSLLHDVRDAAGLSLDEATLEAAVRMGRGSARDALSALDQVAATGSLDSARPAFDELLMALASNDAVAALTALSQLTHEGWEPEQLGESLAGELRQVFLLLVAPDVSDALGDDRERLTEWGRSIGLAKTVRSLETVGRTLREMKSSPVPMILLEVALARLTKPELDANVAALEERVTRLERTPHAAPEASTAPAVHRPIGSVTRTGQATPAPAPAPRPEVPSAPRVIDEPGLTPPATAAVATPSAAEPAAIAPTKMVEGLPSLEEFVDRFNTRVLPTLSRTAQAFLKSTRMTNLSESTLTLAVATEPMRSQADRIHKGVQSAIDQEFGMTLHLNWIVSAESAPAPAAALTATSAPVNEEVEDYAPSDSYDEAEELATNSFSKILIDEAFPGAEEL